jgi:hypothetical protein
LRSASTNGLLLALGQMEGDFVVEVAIEAAESKKRTQTTQKAAHGRYSHRKATTGSTLAEQPE